MKRLFGFLGRLLVRGYETPGEPASRVRHAYAAGWVSIVLLVLLFGVRLGLGLASGAVSVVAASFTLLSDLLASVILVISFRISGRRADSRNPFGHGRMEQVAPLLISFVLFFLGVELAREAVHVLGGAGHGGEHGFNAAVPVILLLTAGVKWFLGGFVHFLGKRIDSAAVQETAGHLTVEGLFSLAVVGGLVAGHLLHLPWLDGLVALGGAVVVFYLSFANARHALVPLLGEAPSQELLDRIRAKARTVPGVEDVHDIIVHTYGRMRVVSLHAEIPEAFQPARMHGTAEKLEYALRKEVGGEVVVHADPLMERTPEVEAWEATLREAAAAVPGAGTFHDFRVVAHSEGRIIIIADFTVDRELDDDGRERIRTLLVEETRRRFPNLAYPVFQLSSRYSY